MKIVYQSVHYEPESVTGVYVRCNGRKGAYVFRVFEASSGTGRFAGKPGFGSTLRDGISNDQIKEVKIIA